MSTYQVTRIKMSASGYLHEHITDLEAGGIWWTKQEVISAIEAGNHFYTVAGSNHAYLKIVHAKVPYVQTYADNTPTDNLLHLPRAT